jgi:uncharacterized protein
VRAARRRPAADAGVAVGDRHLRHARRQPLDEGSQPGEGFLGALLRCLDEARVDGPVNVTAPNPVTNAELAKALGRVLGRPVLLPVPGFALRLLYGEMAQVVTGGQRVLPRRLQALRYVFRRPKLEPALRDALARA